MAAATSGTEGKSRWNKKAVLVLAGAVLAVVVSVVVLAKVTVLAPESAADASRRRAAIDAETNELFIDYPVKDGSKLPWVNPKTGKNTVYPAERCFWTREGKAKLEPTYVLPRETFGQKGPTLCPDCGKPVVPHNPMPPINLMVEASKTSSGKKGG